MNCTNHEIVLEFRIDLLDSICKREHGSLDTLVNLSRLVDEVYVLEGIERPTKAAELE